MPSESLYSEPLKELTVLLVKVSGLSIGSGPTWRLKAEEGVVHRKGVTRLEKCGS
jgi:hypothetical protein